MNDIIWNVETQEFVTIPDGNVATHKQIKDYYDNKLRIALSKVEKHIPTKSKDKKL